MNSTQEEHRARGKVPRRFDRVARLVGAEGLQRLADGHVAVFGLGGVGSYTVEGLARSGVGRLTLVDFDEVCVTNFNRQLHAVEGAVGKSKAALMAERVLAINPRCEVTAHRMFYEATTSAQLLEPRPDVVVDCIDNVTAKLHLLATCLRGGIPVVACMGAAGKLDPTRVRTAPMTKTFMDPLALAVRRNLRRRHGIDNQLMARITAVFSDELPRGPDANYRSSLCGVVCVCPGGQNPHHSCQSRNVVHGSSVFVTSVFGMIAGSVVVDLLLGAQAGGCAVGPAAQRGALNLSS